MGDGAGALRRIPAVGVLLQDPQVEELCRVYPRAVVTAALGELTAELRQYLRQGGQVADPRPWLLERLPALLRDITTPLRRVINATGVVLHTNLGRAPLPAEALAVLAGLEGYCNLEYDLEEGERGSRYLHAVRLLRLLTGAEDALVVNNNAAAVLLCLTVLARGRSVLVSRGELVEIGGGFRIPDVMAQGGAQLVEVGTTNRTHLRDYERALAAGEVALLLKVHRSNFRLQGFTGEVGWIELVNLGRAHGIPVMFDLGSGNLLSSPGTGALAAALAEEPAVPKVVADGVDLVTFSGDKLLGGPQAGIIVGKTELVGQLRSHPLLRALRVGKLTLAALAATLMLYVDPARARERVPALRSLLAEPEQLRRRAARLRRLLVHRLAGVGPGEGGGVSRAVSVRISVVPTSTPVGG
ncbi:MAG TPA: L-seryl-tRNA(Sec) selenium transferase, partial [Firmicutes bacterium]|nr:L-seryl-tRNA(Sec) selenium transferase [Bacillota bacterium]